MVRQACRLEHNIVNNETESLVLESNLIKKKTDLNIMYRLKG